MTARLIDGKAIAESYRQGIADRVAQFRARTNVTPHLAAVLVGEDPASAVYVRNKKLACEKAGLIGTLHKYPADMTQAELLDCVQRLNEDKSVHGILVQLPLPKHIDVGAVLEAVRPEKDVDCFHPTNVGLLVQGQPRFIPCTPYGVQQMLVQAGVTIPGSHVVVLGRSETVGKPVALLLMQKGSAANATVTVCHSQTRDLPAVMRTADILIAAIGRPEFVKAEDVKPGAVVIDVGINRVGDKLLGDVDFKGVSQVASAISPVPGGVGPMTITMLLENTLRAAELCVAMA